MRLDDHSTQIWFGLTDVVLFQRLLAGRDEVDTSLWFHADVCTDRVSRQFSRVQPAVTHLYPPPPCVWVPVVHLSQPFSLQCLLRHERSLVIKRKQFSKAEYVPLSARCFCFFLSEVVFCNLADVITVPYC